MKRHSQSGNWQKRKKKSTNANRISLCLSLSLSRYRKKKQQQNIWGTEDRVNSFHSSESHKRKISYFLFFYRLIIFFAFQAAWPALCAPALAARFASRIYIFILFTQLQLFFHPIRVEWISKAVFLYLFALLSLTLVECSEIVGFPSIIGYCRTWMTSR